MDVKRGYKLQTCGNKVPRKIFRPKRQTVQNEGLVRLATDGFKHFTQYHHDNCPQKSDL
jgi:hypothetical protein